MLAAMHLEELDRLFEPPLAIRQPRIPGEVQQFGLLILAKRCRQLVASRRAFFVEQTFYTLLLVAMSIEHSSRDNQWFRGGVNIMVLAYSTAELLLYCVGHGIWPQGAAEGASNWRVLGVLFLWSPLRLRPRISGGPTSASGGSFSDRVPLLSHPARTIEVAVVALSLIGYAMPDYAAGYRRMRFLHGLRSIRVVTSLIQVLPVTELIAKAVDASCVLLLPAGVFLGFFFVLFGVAATDQLRGAQRLRCAQIIPRLLMGFARNGTHWVRAPGSMGGGSNTTSSGGGGFFSNATVVFRVSEVCLGLGRAVLDECTEVVPPTYCALQAESDFFNPVVCAEPAVCRSLSNSNHGYSSFDNIFLTWLTMIRLSSLSNWSEVMYESWGGQSQVLVGVFFALFIIITAFVILNFIVAIVSSAYDGAKHGGMVAQQGEKFLAKAMENLRIGELLWWNFPEQARHHLQVYASHGDEVTAGVEDPPAVSSGRGSPTTTGVAGRSRSGGPQVRPTKPFFLDYRYVIIRDLWLAFLLLVYCFNGADVSSQYVQLLSVVEMTNLAFFTADIFFSTLAAGSLGLFACRKVQQFDSFAYILTVVGYTERVPMLVVRALLLMGHVDRLRFVRKRNFSRNTLSAAYPALAASSFLAVSLIVGAGVAVQMFSHIDLPGSDGQQQQQRDPLSAGVNSFDSYAIALTNMVRFLTTDSWELIVYQAMNEQSEFLGLLFFIPVYIFFTYIINALFMAVVIAAFERSTEDKLLWQKRVEHCSDSFADDDEATLLLAEAAELDGDGTDSPLVEKLGDMRSPLIAAQSVHYMKKESAGGGGAAGRGGLPGAGARGGGGKPEQPLGIDASHGYIRSSIADLSLALFGIKNPLRVLAIRIVVDDSDYAELRQAAEMRLRRNFASMPHPPPHPPPAAHQHQGKPAAAAVHAAPPPSLNSFSLRQHKQPPSSGNANASVPQSSLLFSEGSDTLHSPLGNSGSKATFADGNKPAPKSPGTTPTNTAIVPPSSLGAKTDPFGGSKHPSTATVASAAASGVPPMPLLDEPPKTYGNIFQLVIIAFVLASCLPILAEPSTEACSVLDAISGSNPFNILALEVVFAVVFTIEMVLKIVAHGVMFPGDDRPWYLGPTYFRDVWNVADFLLLLVMYLSFFYPTVAVLRLMRILRPLRVIRRFGNMKLMVRGLFLSMPTICIVVLISMFFLLIYAIVGIGLFKGLMYYCTTNHLGGQLVVTRSDCQGLHFNERGVLVSAVWRRYESHFDDLPSALSYLIELASMSQWTRLINQVMAISGLEMQPVALSRVHYVAFFFSYIIIVQFFLINIVIGVILAILDELRSILLLTTVQRDWQSLRKVIQQLKPLISPPASSFPRLQKLVLSPTFELVVNAAVFANIIFIASVHYNQSRQWEEAQFYASALFTGFFVLEMVMKLISLRMQYFADRWNCVDLLVVAGSLVEFYFVFVLSDSHSAALTSSARGLRVLRVFRSVKRVSVLRSLFLTLVESLTAILSLVGVIVLIVSMYAILGMALFGNVRYQAHISRDANFRTVTFAWFTVFRMLTLDGWNVLSDELRLSSLPRLCSKDQRGLWYLDSNGETRVCGTLNDCGSELYHIYFFSFYLVAAYLLLNVVVAILLHNFRVLSWHARAPVQPRDFEDMQRVWRKLLHEEGVAWYVEPFLPAKHLPVLIVRLFTKCNRLVYHPTNATTLVHPYLTSRSRSNYRLFLEELEELEMASHAAKLKEAAEALAVQQRRDAIAQGKLEQKQRLQHAKALQEAQRTAKKLALEQQSLATSRRAGRGDAQKERADDNKPTSDHRAPHKVQRRSQTSLSRRDLQAIRAAHAKQFAPSGSPSQAAWQHPTSRRHHPEQQPPSHEEEEEDEDCTSDEDGGSNEKPIETPGVAPSATDSGSLLNTPQSRHLGGDTTPPVAVPGGGRGGPMGASGPATNTPSQGVASPASFVSTTPVSDYPALLGGSGFGSFRQRMPSRVHGSATELSSSDNIAPGEAGSGGAAPPPQVTFAFSETYTFTNILLALARIQMGPAALSLAQQRHRQAVQFHRSCRVMHQDLRRALARARARLDAKEQHGSVVLRSTDGAGGGGGAAYLHQMGGSGGGSIGSFKAFDGLAPTPSCYLRPVVSWVEGPNAASKALSFKFGTAPPPASSGGGAKPDEAAPLPSAIRGSRKGPSPLDLDPCTPFMQQQQQLTQSASAGLLSRPLADRHALFPASNSNCSSAVLIENDATGMFESSQLMSRPGSLAYLYQNLASMPGSFREDGQALPTASLSNKRSLRFQAPVEPSQQPHRPQPSLAAYNFAGHAAAPTADPPAGQDDLENTLAHSGSDQLLAARGASSHRRVTQPPMPAAPAFETDDDDDDSCSTDSVLLTAAGGDSDEFTLILTGVLFHVMQEEARRRQGLAAAFLDALAALHRDSRRRLAARDEPSIVSVAATTGVAGVFEFSPQQQQQPPPPHDTPLMLRRSLDSASGQGRAPVPLFPQQQQQMQLRGSVPARPPMHAGVNPIALQLLPPPVICSADLLCPRYRDPLHCTSHRHTCRHGPRCSNVAAEHRRLFLHGLSFELDVLEEVFIEFTAE